MNTQKVQLLIIFLQQEISEELQLNTLAVFLVIAEKGDCTQHDVEVALNIDQPSASRNVSYWTNRRFDRKPGMGFVERVEDDYDRRFKRLRLSKKGKAFFERLQDKLSA